MYAKVYLEITNVCNKSCSFCPKTQRAPSLMSYSEFDLITDKLIGVTEYIYYHVMGEPTSHPLLPDFIKLANKKGFKSAITTNGSLLKKTGDRLIESGVYKVNISVHSFEQGDDCELTSYLDDCFEFADKSSSSGVLTVLRLWNNGADQVYNSLIEQKLAERFSGDWKRSSRGARLRDKLHLEYGDRFVWPDINAEDMGSKVFCYGLRDHFAILCDGTVVPCCLDHDGDIPLGNALHDDIGSVLASEKAMNIKNCFDRKEAAEELCRKCGYARRFKI